MKTSFQLFFCSGFKCSDDKFTCSNGECVEKNLLCDGDFACKDGSDEDNCECPSGMFNCKDGGCLLATSVCDGTNDCSNGDDEKNCRKHCLTASFPGSLILAPPGKMRDPRNGVDCLTDFIHILTI